MKIFVFTMYTIVQLRHNPLFYTTHKNLHLHYITFFLHLKPIRFIDNLNKSLLSCLQLVSFLFFITFYTLYVHFGTSMHLVFFQWITYTLNQKILVFLTLYLGLPCMYVYIFKYPLTCLPKIFVHFVFFQQNKT